MILKGFQFVENEEAQLVLSKYDKTVFTKGLDALTTEVNK